MDQLFLTGMLRSGTSLLQVLLTNHQNIFFAYQPFHQLYVSIKEAFIRENGLLKNLPLDDGIDGSAAEDELFIKWLNERVFGHDEAANLILSSVTGKGGGGGGLRGKLPVKSGSFFDIHSGLHKFIAHYFGRGDAVFSGSKEVLCEEFIPSLVQKKIRCLIIIRDPRSVIASANNGKYRSLVGDRYPILMLIRLWRKSAAYWLAYRRNPFVMTVRYEDLVAMPEKILSDIANWLEIKPFEKDLITKPLLDHFGNPWKGNSSFGDKVGVQASNSESWRYLLASDEIRFVEAATKPELEALGYSISNDISRDDIGFFCENENGVRESYLSIYRINGTNRSQELRRWDDAEHGRYSNSGSAERLFVFPEAFR